MKKDIEKRMTELHVLEQRLDVGQEEGGKLQEETESYRARRLVITSVFTRREDFKRQIDEINAQLVIVRAVHSLETRSRRL